MEDAPCGENDASGSSVSRDPDLPQSGRNPSSSTEEKARALFMKGVELERSGQVHDAVCEYMKAVHLVPDIEFRAFEIQQRQQAGTAGGSCAGGHPEVAQDDDKCDQLTIESLTLNNDLGSKFSKTCSTICSRKVGLEGSHISCLPMELLVCIMKWVVSSELDLHSLERCSEVCRGFYLASRSSDVWRMVCRDTWGLKDLPRTTVAKMREDDCWRNIFLKRPRVRFNGCYAAKITYTREGERSFQDNEHYRTWYMVHYYRIIRFYPGGKVVMTMTAEEPLKAHKLLNNCSSPGIQGCLVGRYQTVRERVRCVVQHKKEHENDSLGGGGGRRRRPKVETSFEVPDQVFHFELELKGKNYRKLTWKNYSVISRFPSKGVDEETNIDTQCGNSYPAMQWIRASAPPRETQAAVQ